jgi:hypothetical protein
MGETQEGVVILACAEVQPHATLHAVGRAGSNLAEAHEALCLRLHTHHATLISPFQVAEEEKPVSLEGSAECEPKLFSLEERVVRERIQEIVAQQNAARAAKKKPPAPETSKLMNAQAFRERIQEIVKRQHDEAVEATTRKPPASQTRKPKLRRKPK